MEERNMKLIFKYKYREYRFSKEYIKICESLRREKEIPKKIGYEKLWNLILKKNILNEVYLSNYLYDTDYELAEFVLKKLNDENISYCDIGSQGWDVELENDKVIIAEMCSSEEDERAYINREEVAYAMSKWRDFLKREIIDGSYEEIIDTENVYKKEKVEK
jgi:hypothetical protein